IPIKFLGDLVERGGGSHSTASISSQGRLSSTGLHTPANWSIRNIVIPHNCPALDLESTPVICCWCRESRPLLGCGRAVLDNTRFTSTRGKGTNPSQQFVSLDHGASAVFAGHQFSSADRLKNSGAGKSSSQRCLLGAEGKARYGSLSGFWSKGIHVCP